jgi:hypothetical protein
VAHPSSSSAKHICDWSWRPMSTTTTTSDHTAGSTYTHPMAHQQSRPSHAPRSRDATASADSSTSTAERLRDPRGRRAQPERGDAPRLWRAPARSHASHARSRATLASTAELARLAARPCFAKAHHRHVRGTLHLRRQSGHRRRGSDVGQVAGAGSPTAGRLLPDRRLARHASRPQLAATAYATGAAVHAWDLTMAIG